MDYYGARIDHFESFGNVLFINYISIPGLGHVLDSEFTVKRKVQRPFTS